MTVAGDDHGGQTCRTRSPQSARRARDRQRALRGPSRAPTGRSVKVGRIRAWASESSAVTMVSAIPSPISWRTSGSTQLRRPPADDGDPIHPRRTGVMTRSIKARARRDVAAQHGLLEHVVLGPVDVAASNSVSTRTRSNAALAQLGDDALALVAADQQLPYRSTVHSMSRPCAANAALNAMRCPSRSTSARRRRRRRSRAPSGSTVGAGRSPGVPPERPARQVFCRVIGTEEGCPTSHARQPPPSGGLAQANLLNHDSRRP